MKQKLPERESSYKNLYLGKIQKTKILSNSWAKYSLIRLLIATFFDKKNVVNSPDFQIITLRLNLRNLKNNKNFILNSLMLFALPASIFIYRSNTINIVEKKNFSLIKVQRQYRCKKNYISVYRKSFQNLNKNLDFSTREITKNNNIRYSHTINKNGEKKLQFFHSINQFHDSHTDNSNLGWPKRILYLKDKSVSTKPVLIKRTFLNKSLSFLRRSPPQNSFFQFLGNPLMGSKYIINNFFSRQKKRKVNPKIFFYFERSLMAEFRQNTILEKNNRVLKNLEKVNKLRKNIESDDIQIISWKIREYHSNFLLNYMLPFNHTYNIICKNYSFNKKFRYKVKGNFNRLFVEIFNLLPLFFEFEEKISWRNCIQLKEHLIKKTNELDILMDQSNKMKDLDFSNKKILLMYKDKNHTFKNNNGLNHYLYLFIENFIRKSKYYSKLHKNNLSFRLSNSEYKHDILHKYSIWRRNLENHFIYNIGNIKSNKFGFKVYNWLYQIKTSSEKVLPYHFRIKLKLTQFLKKNFNSKNIIDKSSNSLQISTDIRNIEMQKNEIGNRSLIKKIQFSDKNMNTLLDDLSINGITDEISPILLTTFLTKNPKLFHSSYNLDFYNFSRNFQLNYREIFFFYWKKNDIENNSIIYSQFRKNLLKYNKLNQTFIKQRSLFIEKEISRFIQLKLNNRKFFKILDNKFDRIKFIFFYYFHPKIYLSKRKINQTQNVLQNLDNTKIKNYYNILQYDSLTKSINRNSSLFQSINKIFLSPILKDSNVKNLKHKFEKKLPIGPYKVDGKSNQIEFFNLFNKNKLVKDYNYTYWFFTYEWWEYTINLLADTLPKGFVLVGFYFEYFINNNIKLIHENLVNVYEKKRKLYTLKSKWNANIFFDYIDEIPLNFVWSDLKSINIFDNLHLTILSLMVFILLFSQNVFSILIGSDSMNLWKYFENIKYLTDIFRVSYFTKLSNRRKTQLNETENLFIYFFSNLKHYTKNIQFYLLTKKKLNQLLISNKSLDRSRRKRNLLVQSLITPTRIKEYGFQLYYQPKILNHQLVGYNRNPQQGLLYLQYLGQIFKRNLMNQSIHLADKWIFFASLQKIISSQTLRQTKKIDVRFQKMPIPLQLGLSCSKGILLIGPVETGRSYLIKNLAADSSVPLLAISINKLLYNKPDVVTESWMNILIESLRRLNLTLELAKGISPCIIWIRNIHQLDVKRSTQNIESDPTFLLGISLKYFQTTPFETQTKKNIIMIGSTHVPKKVDPSLISPDRLDRVLNIRLLNTYQRKNQLPILLNRNNLKLNKNLLSLNEFGFRTIGYNIRDLAALTNEISLISLTKNQLFVSDEIIKLAFHRQVIGFSHTNNKPNYQQNFKILLYKIGRAIVQNMMIEGSVNSPLNISNYLWKRKFYYLSKWYSEPSSDDSIIKESTILVHILGCLAGIAARDSWFQFERDYDISLDKSVENDLDLAFSLLENFSTDFPLLETCKTQFLNYRKKKQKIFLTKNFSNIMHSGIFAMANKSIIGGENGAQYESLLSENNFVSRKICQFDNTTWSPRLWRLSFSRSQLFDWIKRPNEFKFSHTFGSSEKTHLEGNNYDQLIHKKKEQLFYERILPRVRKRNVEELESQFANILLEEQFEILGFFGSATQYQMESRLDNNPRLFIGKRILWNPIGSFSQSSHFVFSRREFFVDEEMLRRLYITYGVRRERERSLSSHRIKRFFICRGYDKELINKLSVRWWNQLPSDHKQNIYMLKRIEKMGIRLKRPQIFTPVYLYQRWLIENVPEKFSRLDLLNHRDRWIKLNKLLSNDSFIYNILLESYQYLFEFFLFNKILLEQMTKTLLIKKWIFQNEIKDIIHNIKNTEF